MGEGWSPGHRPEVFRDLSTPLGLRGASRAEIVLEACLDNRHIIGFSFGYLYELTSKDTNLGTCRCRADPRIQRGPSIALGFRRSARLFDSLPGICQGFRREGIRAQHGRFSGGLCSRGTLASPGVEPDEEAMIGLMQRAVPESFLADAFAVFEQMSGFHPQEPHWYLPLIGVDPARQGAGHGTELMRHALRRCDADHKLAYLESSNPRNTPFYERLGFERLGVIQAGTSPQIVPMLRKPR